MKLLPWAAALCLSISASLPALARELTDVTGKKIELVEKPSRIVTLAPSLGELAADLAAERIDRIVGVTEYTDYPPALAKVKSVGPYHRFNLEAVVALKPDLVLATRDGNLKDQVEHLRELKIPVVVVSTENFREVAQSIRLVAQAMGEPAEGERMASQFSQGLAHIQERAQARARTRAPRAVMIQLNADPLIVAGRKAFLHDALEAVGARNAFQNLEAAYPRPSLEDALARNPDVIIVLGLGSDLKPFQQMAKAWGAFPALRAVKSGEVRVLQGDALTRPTLRLLEGLSVLEKAVYGK